MIKLPTDLKARLPKIDLDAGRRAFIRHAGLGAASVAVFGVTGLPTDAEAQIITDDVILNFALNLEYLEAEFYVRAAFDRGLPDDITTGNGERGPVIGGRAVNFESRTIRNYANEIATDEESHVRFFRSALGSAAVARPTINLDTSFTAAAVAAGLIPSGQTFDAFANENNFLLAAYIFEDVGVTAFKGAARFITNPDILEATAGVLAVEAYHAGLIRTVLYSREFFAPAQAISDARDALDGPEDLDQGIGNAEVANIVPTDNNGIAFSRTPQQVLNVVYLDDGDPEPQPFSFFPNGTNGAVR